MKKIRNYIEDNNKKFAQHKLIGYLSNQSIDPKQRLLIAPCMAHFAMSFTARS